VEDADEGEMYIGMDAADEPSADGMNASLGETGTSGLACSC